MGMDAILFNGIEPFVNILSAEVWNVVKIIYMVSEKKALKRFHNFIHVHSPGIRADNPQNFNGSWTVLLFLSYIESLSQKMIFFIIFPIQMYRECKSDLAIKGSKVNLRPTFEKIVRPWVSDVIHSLKAFLVQVKKIFMCFYHIWVWRPYCSMALNPLNKLSRSFWQKPLCDSWWNYIDSFRRRHLKIIECSRPRGGGGWGLNPRPPGLQSDGASNWATKAGAAISLLNILREWLFYIFPIQLTDCVWV